MSNYSVQVSLDGKDNLTPVLQSASGELETMEENSGNVSSGMDGIANAAIGMGIAWAASHAISMISDLSKMGDEANDANDVFVQLAGGTANATNMLMVMQTASGGVISNMHLQEEASKALSLNLVHNADDMGSLVQLGSELGASMGKTATEGVDELTQSLASGRLQGLKDLGVDIVAVQERMDELKKSGLSTSDAMRQATFEVAGQHLKDLGAGAKVGQDAIDKLKTHWDNFVESAAKDVNMVVNVIANDANHVLFGDPDADAAKTQIEQFATANATVYGGQFYDTVKEQFSQASKTVEFFTPENSQAILESLFRNMKANPEAGLQQAIQDTLQPIMDMGIDDEHVQMLAGQLYLVGQLEEKTVSTAKAQQDQVKLLAEQAVQAKLLNDAQNLSDLDKQDSLQQQREALDLAHQHNEATFEYNNALAQVGNQLLSITNIGDPMAALYTDKISASDADAMLPDFMKPEYAAEITNQYQQAADELDRLKGMRDQGLISDDQLTQAENMTDNLSKLADQAQRAADNFKNMSLSEALGTNDADKMGTEMSKMIMDEAKKGGLSDKQLAGLQGQFDISDGTVTEASKTLADQVVPLIVDISKTMGPEMAEIAKKNVEDYLQQAKVEGLSDTQTASGLQFATGVFQSPIDRNAALNGHDTPAYQLEGGFDASQYAQSLMSDTTVQAVQEVTDNSKMMGDNMTEVSVKFIDVNAQASTLQGVLAEMAAKVHTVTIDLKVNGLDALNAVSAATGGAAVNTRDNGGRPAGVDARTGPPG